MYPKRKTTYNNQYLSISSRIIKYDHNRKTDKQAPEIRTKEPILFWQFWPVDGYGSGLGPPGSSRSAW
jgi:hypothetical protein